MVAGRARRRAGRARDQLLRRDGDDHPGVAGRRGRRAGHPADAGAGRRAGASGSSGTLDKPLLLLGILLLLGLALRVRRPAGAARWWAPASSTPCSAARRRASRWRPSAAPPRSTTCRSRSASSTWLVVPVAADRAAAPGRARGRAAPARRAEEPTASTGGGPEPDRTRRALPDPGRRDRRRRRSSLAASGRVVGRGRRHVEETRRLLRLPGVTAPEVPPARRVGLKGIAPWQTPNDDFYLIDTAIVVPDHRAAATGRCGSTAWSTARSADLRRAARPASVTEAWITLNCVSNEVGGDLIGNAWWSGVRRRATCSPRPASQAGADAVLQTSRRRLDLRDPAGGADRRPQRDARRRDERRAAADRARLPGAHDRARALRLRLGDQVGRRHGGHQVRRLLGVLDRARAGREQGPVKMSSRIDVPRSGDEVAAGEVPVRRRRLGAAHRHRGRGGRGRRRRLADRPSSAGCPNVDTWVQWAATVDVEPGDHTLRVRATDADGNVQTGVEPTCSPTAPPAGTPSTSRAIASA